MVTYEEIILGAKYAVRISDLTQSDGLKITCWICDHSAIIPAGRLKSKFRNYMRLILIENKLPCGQCGNRTGNTWRTVRKK